MEQQITRTVGICIAGYALGVGPLEASVAIAFAAGACLCMESLVKLPFRKYVTIVLMSSVFSVICAGTISTYTNLAQPVNLLMCCITGLTSPFLMFELLKWLPVTIRRLLTLIRKKLESFVDSIKSNKR